MYLNIYVILLEVTVASSGLITCLLFFTEYRDYMQWHPTPEQHNNIQYGICII